MQISLEEGLGNKTFHFVGFPQKHQRHKRCGSGNKLNHKCLELYQVLAVAVSSHVDRSMRAFAKGRAIALLEQKGLGLLLA